MNEIKIRKYEQILGKKLEDKEIQRLSQIKDIFEIHDNDALWDIVIIMEYYTRLCEAIPEQIKNILSAQPKHENSADPDLTGRLNGNKFRLLQIFFGLSIALISISIGYFFAKKNFELMQFIKIILIGISCLSCIYFSANYIKFALNSDKKWVANAGLALLSLVCGLMLLLI